MKTDRLVLRLFVSFLFGVAMSAHAQDVERSWTKAQVALPDTFFLKSTDNIKVEKPLPVVLYLHGCTGIFWKHDIRWAKFISDMGFIVILPDSMARPNRKSNCDPQYHGPTEIFPQAYEYRQEEITYALEQIRKSTWADKRNIFLMGHSEGGIATAQSAHEGFRGNIISGWTCTNRLGPKTQHPELDGIRSPKNVPVLAIAYLDDVWRKGKNNEGRCADKADGRDVTQVDLEGAGHETFDDRLAKDSVTAFLKKHLVM